MSSKSRRSKHRTNSSARQIQTMKSQSSLPFFLVTNMNDACKSDVKKFQTHTLCACRQRFIFRVCHSVTYPKILVSAIEKFKKKKKKTCLTKKNESNKQKIKYPVDIEQLFNNRESYCSSERGAHLESE